MLSKVKASNILTSFVLSCSLLMASSEATGMAKAAANNGEQIIEASKTLNGKLFSVWLRVNKLPKSVHRNDSAERPINNSPITGGYTYTHKMELSYGGQRIDYYPEVLLYLFDPWEIESIDLSQDGHLVFTVPGADAAQGYRYRFYVDPQALQLNRVGLAPYDKSEPGEIIKSFRFKPTLSSKK